MTSLRHRSHPTRSRSMSRRNSLRAAISALVAAAACGHPPVPSATPATTLKDAFRSAFRVGAALNANQFSGLDARGAALVKTQFNTISPENVLKWEAVHPQPGVYDFNAPVKYFAFGEQNGMFVIGHTLVWHSQTPRWVFQDANGQPVTRDTLLARMRDHIHTLVGRYKGRVKGWDVVNEALNEDGTLRKSPWLTIIGDDFIAKAFQFAHEADPAAELYYNDYSVENTAKRNGAVQLISKLKAQGVPVAAIGLQGHDKMDWPTPSQQDSTIVALSRLGVKVNITELDVDVLPPAVQNRTADVAVRAELDPRTNPYVAGLPDSMQQALAARYAALF